MAEITHSVGLPYFPAYKYFFHQFRTSNLYNGATYEHTFLSVSVKYAAEGKICCHISALPLYPTRIGAVAFVENETGRFT